jgi:hypothetical protein
MYRTSKGRCGKFSICKEKLLQEKAAEATKQKEEKRKNLGPRNNIPQHTYIHTAYRSIRFAVYCMAAAHCSG